MKDLTIRQKSILDTIRKLRAEHGYCPSFRDIADSEGISLKCAVDHLVALKKKGYISYIEKKARTIRIVEDK